MQGSQRHEILNNFENNLVYQCSKLTLVHRPMANNFPAGLATFEEITLKSALMNFRYTHEYSHQGRQPKKLVSNTV